MTTQTAQLQTRTKPAVERMEQRPQKAPAVDIYEGKDDFLVVADVPGTDDNTFVVELEQNELRLRAPARPFEPEDSAFDWVRTFRLPPGIDGNAVSAELQHGVLTVRVPKPAEHKPRRIDVKSAV